MNIFGKNSNFITGSFFSSTDQVISIGGRNGNSSSVPPAGPIGSKDVPITQISRLEAGSAFDITVTKGSAPKLTITAEERILPNIVASQRGNKLVLSIEGSVSTQGPLKVDLVVESLTDIDLSGASSLSFDDVAGASLNLDVSGSASVKLSGMVGELTLDVSGAAKVRCHKLRAAKVNADISGAASVRVYAESSVTGDVSGAASLEIDGTAVSRKVRTSGAASVSFD